MPDGDNFSEVSYTLCKHCDHFVDPDWDDGGDGVERYYVHLEDGEPGHLGEDGFYLFAAIATGGQCQWPRDRPLVKMLQQNEPLWRRVAPFIEFDDDST